ncbi:hypothetical protein IV203_016472 [Nitzschia inconspicua]|uniref:Uncharacterized protein n=1 Tax=Nitzschia inconspicua TaxID=303405 RepID=A0A9K3KQR7_9STRA|nr:hypothetical protein IV203_016472 [Nitzschia inconspicua]
MVTFTLEEVDDDDIEWDLQQSFDAMDDEKLGRLSIDAAYTLLLGLGYMRDYKLRDRFTTEDMTFAVRALRREQKVKNGEPFSKDDGDWVTMEILKQVIEMYSFVLQRDRSAPVFQSAIEGIDQGHKGFLDASDVQKLGSSVGDSISKKEAEAMIEVTRRVLEGEREDDATGVMSRETTTLDYGHIQQLLSPPEDDQEGMF